MKPEEQALFANDTFYLAFAQKDFDVMARLWTKQHPVMCIHPGWPVITGRAEVIESWRRILGNPEQPGIDFYNAATLTVHDMVFVTCYEELPGSICVATNGFVSERGGMRMFHHQSGPCANPPPPTGPGGTAAKTEDKPR